MLLFKLFSLFLTFCLTSTIFYGEWSSVTSVWKLFHGIRSTSQTPVVVGLRVTWCMTSSNPSDWSAVTRDRPFTCVTSPRTTCVCDLRQFARRATQVEVTDRRRPWRILYDRLSSDHRDPVNVYSRVSMNGWEVPSVFSLFMRGYVTIINSSSAAAAPSLGVQSTVADHGERWVLGCRGESGVAHYVVIKPSCWRSTLRSSPDRSGRNAFMDIAVREITSRSLARYMYLGFPKKIFAVLVVRDNQVVLILSFKLVSFFLYILSLLITIIRSWAGY